MGQLGKSPEKEVIGFFLAFYLLLFVSVISTVKNHWYLPNKKPDWFLLQTAWSVNPFYHHTNQKPHLKKKKKKASLARANRPGAHICHIHRKAWVPAGYIFRLFIDSFVAPNILNQLEQRCGEWGRRSVWRWEFNWLKNLGRCEKQFKETKSRTVIFREL